MTTLAYSHTLVAGTPENINDVQDMFGDIRTVMNGNLDATNLATSAKPAMLMGAYRTVSEVTNFLSGSNAAATYYPATGGFPFASGSAGGSGVPFPIPITPADYAVSSLTTQFRLRVSTMTNATAPGVNFTYGLYPITSNAGGSGGMTLTLGTVVSGSTIVQTTPGGSANTNLTGSDFTISSGAAYILAFATSGTTAVASYTAVTMALQVHNI